MTFNAYFAGWSENNDLAGLRVQGDVTRYGVNWGDGTTEYVSNSEDFDGDGVYDAAFGWHTYASDGTYQVGVSQPGAGLPPERLTAYMYARDDGDLVFRTTNRDEMISTGNGNDNVRAGGGSDLVVTAGGNDRLDGGDGDDALLGGNGNDILLGGAGSDFLGGGAGADRIYGGGGDVDSIYGDEGNDIIYGEAGFNFINGGIGADRLYGGADGDVFTFAPEIYVDTPLDDPDRDTVYDFQHGSDSIDVARWVAEGSFTFIGAARFGGTGPELRAVNNGSFTVVQGDWDGDRQADFQIRVEGGTALVASDFQGVSSVVSDSARGDDAMLYGHLANGLLV